MIWFAIARDSGRQLNPCRVLLKTCESNALVRWAAAAAVDRSLVRGHPFDFGTIRLDSIRLAVPVKVGIIRLSCPLFHVPELLADPHTVSQDTEKNPINSAIANVAISFLFYLFILSLFLFFPFYFVIYLMLLHLPPILAWNVICKKERKSAPREIG